MPPAEVSVTNGNHCRSIACTPPSGFLPSQVPLVVSKTLASIADRIGRSLNR